MERSRANSNPNRFLNLRIANGRFILKQKLGSGSFGEIFCGLDTARGHKAVAIKLEKVWGTKRPRLACEARVYRHLHEGGNSVATNSSQLTSTARGSVGVEQQQQQPHGYDKSNNGTITSESADWSLRMPNTTVRPSDRAENRSHRPAPGGDDEQTFARPFYMSVHEQQLVLAGGQQPPNSDTADDAFGVSLPLNNNINNNNNGYDPLHSSGINNNHNFNSNNNGGAGIPASRYNNEMSGATGVSNARLIRGGNNVDATKQQQQQQPNYYSNGNTTVSTLTSGGGTSIGSANINFVVGVPNIYYYGVEGDYNVMVIDLCGPSLEDLFCYCGRRFSLKTICLLADQILHRIQYVHSKNFIHRDIKPENFVMGVGDKSHHVNLIDYGLAKRYWDSDLNRHLPYDEGRNVVGTVRYCSVNTHLGISQSRRDDLESIGYMLLYFHKGRLPWQGIRGLDPARKTARIGDRKITMSVEYMCRDYPSPFVRYLKYTRMLRFEEAPDYQFCRRIFSDFAEHEKIRRDWIFDWVGKRERERQFVSQSNNDEYVESTGGGATSNSVTGVTSSANVFSPQSYSNQESGTNPLYQRTNVVSHRSLI